MPPSRSQPRRVHPKPGVVESILSTPGVLRAAVAVATCAGSKKPGTDRTGLPASPAVGLRVVNGFIQVWAGDGSTLAILNQRTDLDRNGPVFLDGDDLRELVLPAVLRRCTTTIRGSRIQITASGWTGSVRIHRRGPFDPGSAILGLLLADHRRCPAPSHRVARMLAGPRARWFIPTFPFQQSTRIAALSKRRCVIVATAPITLGKAKSPCR